MLMSNNESIRSIEGHNDLFLRISFRKKSSIEYKKKCLSLFHEHLESTEVNEIFRGQSHSHKSDLISIRNQGRRKVGRKSEGEGGVHGLSKDKGAIIPLPTTVPTALEMRSFNA